MCGKAVGPASGRERRGPPSGFAHWSKTPNLGSVSVPFPLPACRRRIDQEEDSMSSRERVTWETCPTCGLSAAVGWRDGTLIAVDCPGGCQLTAVDLTRRGAKRLRFRLPVAPEPTAGGVARAAAGPTPSALRSER